LSGLGRTTMRTNGIAGIWHDFSQLGERLPSNSALLTDAFSSLRCAYGAAKRGR
jgi:hypothetical protein